jgi:acyl transferase domain-containing protein
VNTDDQRTGLEIAIIGMVGRFPGAENIAAFWRNLCQGVESISSFSDDELAEAGTDPAVLCDQDYVKAGAVLDDVELFDAGFFGYTPREAEIMDPQYRLFLEAAWEALEHAGHTADTFGRPIGMYAGVGLSSYLLNNLLPNRDWIEDSVGFVQAIIGNDRDHLSTLASYKLDLTGPSITVQTACSTSLVAVHLACQGLLSGDCDMALAGGVAITIPQRAGYRYQVGGIYSPDGHCRAFAADAQGTVGGNGLGIVVLKRLTDALADNDRIYAVIKGSAINNDGMRKIGYTAPSVEGQARVIRAAHVMADVAPDTISYIEAHGTATPLGDPIEIAALNRVFRAETERRGFCAIGSVKTNIGHLDAAAGVAGLIKTVLMLDQRQIPPSLHFDAPNPQIDFQQSPFYVNTTLDEWPAAAGPRRAGVSSFGIGGTNAHIVLEEAPPTTASAARPWHLLPIAARTPAALDSATRRLAAHLREHPQLSLADVAYTMQLGRKAFSHRRILVCRDLGDALAALEAADAQRLVDGVHEQSDRTVAFMFPGQGAQHAQMARELYETEPVFREQVDHCAELLLPELGRDLRAVLYPHDEGRTTTDEGADAPFVVRPSSDAAGTLLDQTWLTQPALFVIEYALARLWMAWGVRPAAMIGHSIGEYVAATLADVLSLEAALRLVAARGRLMQQLPGGAMLRVPLAEAQLRELLTDDLALAANNAPGFCVVAGPHKPISALQAQLTAQGVETRALHTSHAFHSAMMDPILDAFADLVSQVELQAPQLPYISNLTGTWITAAEATSMRYWVDHLRHTVRFGTGIQTLLAEAHVLLEVGPGQALGTLARQQGLSAAAPILASLPRAGAAQTSDNQAVLSALGKLWLAGVPIDWHGYYAHERRQRLALPTYPFERQRYWVAPRQPAARAHVDQLDAAVSPVAQYPRPPLMAPFVAPRNEIEQIIAEVWQAALGVEQVGVYDDFVELGGHSLLATQVTFRLREIFPVDLSLQHFFQANTVAQLAEMIDELLITAVENLSDDEIQRFAPIATE